MKKVLSLLTAAVMCAALAACGTNGNTTENNGAATETSVNTSEVDYHNLAAWGGTWNSIVAYLDGEAADVFEGDDEKG